MSPSTEGCNSGASFHSAEAQQGAAAGATGGRTNPDPSRVVPGDRAVRADGTGPSVPTVEDLGRWVQEARGWFFDLPSAGRIVVLALAIVTGFSLLRAVLEVVASFVSLAMLLLVAYVVYKIFIAGDWPSDSRQ